MNRRSTHIFGIGSQAGSVLFSQWNEFGRLNKLVQKHGDVDSIHDLRVVTRRLRATLALFAPFISGKVLKLLVREIRKITRTLGVIRTIDEAIIFFEPCSESLPILTSVLDSVRKREMRRVLNALKLFRHNDVDRKLRIAVSELAGIDDDSGHAGSDSISTHLNEISAQRYHVIHDLLLPSVVPENVEVRHALRIAIKKWRYSLETLGQVCGKDYGDTLESLKAYQSVLGTLNDMAEFGVLCDTLSLQLDEIEEIRAMLGKDAGEYLLRFLAMATSHPLKFPDIP